MRCALVTAWLAALLGLPAACAPGQTPPPVPPSTNQLPPVAAAALPSTNQTPRAAALPKAEELLSQVLARLPQEAVTIQARLQTGQTVAATGAVLTLEMKVRTSPAGGVRTDYTLCDAFGVEREQMTVTRPAGGPPLFAYARGAPLQSTPVPDLLQPIAGTAMCWADLTLAFLWWHGGTTIGIQEVKDQPCYVVDLLSPSRTASDYTRVRVWIDTRVTMLLQAEGYDPLGDVVRRITIKSFKKIHGEWMVKDLEVECFPTGQRTLLRVLDMRVGNDAPADNP